MRIFSFFLFSVSALVTACNSTYTAKPAGYFKIDFPEKKYHVFDQPGYPYTFEYPVYGVVIKDSTFFDQQAENPWWINIDFPEFSGRIYVSYKEIGKFRFDDLMTDAFKLSSKHTIKASGMTDSLIQTPSNIHGRYFKVEGNVATANQFFLTDSTKHFLRGALYFDATPNEDSLAVVNRFLVEDIHHLINSFRWKTK